MTIPDWTDCGYDDETDTLRGHTYRDGDIIVGKFERRGIVSTTRVVRYESEGGYITEEGEPLDLHHTLVSWRHATETEYDAFMRARKRGGAK